jgi:predicted PolB exonuclease-like 3'-5' exonuclease
MYRTVKLFFDIETVPCNTEEREVFLEILKKRAKNAELDEETLFEQTALEGTFGRLCCIGYIKEDGKVEKGVLRGSEKEILTKFWEVAQGVNRFIGHNIWEFDLPFIYKRSIINGIKPRYDISFARYRNMPIFDTLQEWELWGYGSKQKLDTLAKVLKLPTSKDLMDGSEVWKYYQDGRIDEICTYCMKDVELTRQVYYKMTFEEMMLEEKVVVAERQREYIAATKLENHLIDEKGKQAAKAILEEKPQLSEQEQLDEAIQSLFKKKAYEEKEFDF